MKRLSLVIMIALLLGLVALPWISAGLAEEEKTIDLSSTPAAIQQALDGVDVVEIEKTADNHYEVEMRAGNHEVELILSEDAKLLGVEIEVDDDKDGEDDDDNDGEDDSNGTASRRTK